MRRCPELRAVPHGPVLRRQRRSRGLRRRDLYPSHLPTAEHRVRAGRRRVRGHALVRHVSQPAGVRRRRARALWLWRLFSAELHATGAVMRPRRRWLRQPASVWGVQRTRHLRRWGQPGHLRAPLVPASHLRPGQRRVRGHRRWVWRHGELRYVRQSADLRRQRRALPVWRHHVTQRLAASASSTSTASAVARTSGGLPAWPSPPVRTTRGGGRNVGPLNSRWVDRPLGSPRPRPMPRGHADRPRSRRSAW